MDIIPKKFPNAHEITFEIIQDKKVLLRERRRHTARRVSSTPLMFLKGGYPHPVVARGGTPTSSGWGVPPSSLGWGVSPPISQMGIPFHPAVNRQTENSDLNSTFPHPSDAGGKNSSVFNGFLSRIIFHELNLCEIYTGLTTLGIYVKVIWL